MCAAETDPVLRNQILTNLHAARGIDSKSQPAHPTPDQRFLQRIAKTQRDIGLAPHQVEPHVRDQQFDRDAGPFAAECRQIRGQQADCQHVGGGDADLAAQPVILPDDLATDAGNLVIDAGGGDLHRFAGGGENIA